MKLIYLKSALKYDSFDVTIGIKVPFFRVSVTIEPCRSLLQFVTTNCLIIILQFQIQKILKILQSRIACKFSRVKNDQNVERTCSRRNSWEKLLENLRTIYFEFPTILSGYRPRKSIIWACKLCFDYLHGKLYVRLNFRI